VSHQRKPQGLPKNTELLILFTDFLGHNVMRHFRNMAQTQGVPFIACADLQAAWHSRWNVVLIEK